MQKIIDGYLYDTATATLLYEDKSNYPRNIDYYVTPKHNYFVVYSNKELQVVEEAFIKDILGKNDIAKYIEVFGEPQEG